MAADKIFRRKRLSTGANFVHIYLEIWDKGILMFKILDCNENKIDIHLFIHHENMSILF